MSKFIVSRASNNIRYAIYKKNPNKTFSIEKEIVVKGGSDVINKKTLITEKGVYTQVEDAELELLQSNPTFKKHLENGFITIVNTKNDAEKVKESEDLQQSNSAQLTQEKLEEEDENIIVDDNVSKKKGRKKKNE